MTKQTIVHVDVCKSADKRCSNSQQPAAFDPERAKRSYQNPVAANPLRPVFLCWQPAVTQRSRRMRCAECRRISWWGEGVAETENLLTDVMLMAPKFQQRTARFPENCYPSLPLATPEPPKDCVHAMCTPQHAPGGNAKCSKNQSMARNIALASAC